MLIVPIGVDCGIAEFLRNKNMRTSSLPFDWCVTYNGVYDIIKNNFSTFLPKDNSSFCNLSCTSFVHSTFPDDVEKMKRRAQRFIDILNNTSEDVIFFRKGHAQHNHQEAVNFNCPIKNDILDSEDLASFLKEKYPNLKFKIITILFCTKCFNINEVYKSNTDSVIIYNEALDNIDNDTLNNILNTIIMSLYRT